MAHAAHCLLGICSCCWSCCCREERPAEEYAHLSPENEKSPEDEKVALQKRLNRLMQILPDRNNLPKREAVIYKICLELLGNMVYRPDACEKVRSYHKANESFINLNRVTDLERREWVFRRLIRAEGLRAADRPLIRTVTTQYFPG